MQNILIIEDDVDIAELISFNLERNQYKTLITHNGLDGLNKAIETTPDLIVLDLMLPGMDGINVHKELKRDSRTRDIPVMMLTAKAQTQDRITGLETGADDYLTKPFSPKELVLRIQAILKRTTTKSGGTILSLGPFQFDKNSLSFHLDGEPVDLTATEFKLMIFLCERVNAPQSRNTLLKEVWGYSGDVHSRTLDTHMKRLRRKLNPFSNQLETVRGIGYRIVDTPSKDS